MSGDEQVTSSSADPMQNVLTISPSNILAISPNSHVDLDLKADLQDEEEGVAVSPGNIFASQGLLVSPSLNNPTLQSLLTSPTSLQGTPLGLPEGIQIITVPTSASLLNTQTDNLGRIWHVINPDDTIIAVGNEELKHLALVNGESFEEVEQVSSTTAGTVLGDTLDGNPDLASVLMPPPQQPLPPGCPSWAARLRNCEKIGDYYRGYVDSEVDLDILLTYHKQATQSFWGTRQSPSPAKQSTRFMWKSQYVPFDGIPFVNTGSRAVVMECQYGPRRKGSLLKKQIDTGASGEYKQTCPARIYIKKVKKFPLYKVDLNLDKKALKAAMDKAFHALKQQNIEKIGQDRYYVQLPLPSAHEFHDGLQPRGGSSVPLHQVSTQTDIQESSPEEIMDDELEETAELQEKRHRLHPLVASKIREIVAGGEVRVYQVRKLLRMYVCQHLFHSLPNSNVSRHDLSLFPTITDLKNHIHQAVKDIENGSLALTAPQVNVEPVSAGNNLVQMGLIPPTSSTCPVPETVTVTLTQSPGEEGGHVISRIETHMSDGTTKISSSLTSETAQLLARLNPAMFPPGSLVHVCFSSDTNKKSTLKEESESRVKVEAVTSAADSSSPSALYTTTFPAFTIPQSVPMEVQDSEDTLTLSANQDQPSSLPANITITPVEISHVPTSVLPAEIVGIGEHTPQLVNVTIVPSGEEVGDVQTDSGDEEL